MQRPSKAGVIFLLLFGSPFLVMGLVFALVSANKGDHNAWVGVIFGLIFATVGLGVMAAAIGGYRIANRQADRAAENPDKPWLWREDWASGRANGGDARANITIWVFTIIWDFISFFLAAMLLPKLLKDADPRALLVLIFPVAAVFITGFAIRGTLRLQRYGRTSFWFDSAPFSPGGRVKGVIRLKLPTAIPHGIDLRLSCKRRIVTGSGKNQSVNELVLWQQEKNVPADSVMQGLTGAEIPVELPIPPDAYETDTDNPNDSVRWELHAQADVPGADFNDNYELPVFRTQAAAAAAGESSSTFSGAATAPTPQVESPAPAPAETHVINREDEQGTTFYFPPLRNHGQALGVVAFATIWSAVVYFLWVHEGVPWIFRIVFSLFEVLIGYMLLSVVFGSALIRVRGGMLEVRSAILGIGSLKQMPFSDVAAISLLSQGRTNTAGDVLYGINIRKSDGRDINIAPSSLTHVEARWIVSKVESAMGRKQDTRVQFQSIYGAPPQPSPYSAGPSLPTNAPLRFKTGHKQIGVVAIAVWMLFMGLTFYRGFSRSGPVNRSRAGGNRARVTSIPRIPMTDADVERINALPVQQRAEELLERSINHDEHALEMFSDNIEEWTSEVRLTDHMKQLEARSLYSKDLRVRQANADLWLAMEGWHRNQEAVDLLLKRADQDKQYRPSAYFFLGMEGGRGIDSEHVFAVLSERAIEDTDPVVRQWAIEGLRFFKSDEALDVMFQSFTHDASYTVRDRAGCNLSDCGIFTRAQRMRFVPKLIELAGDRSLNPQMRNWVFMALREITDVSLAGDANSWQKWYEEHGAEKTREFESLPWYQVRGDE